MGSEAQRDHIHLGKHRGIMAVDMFVFKSSLWPEDFSASVFLMRGQWLTGHSNMDGLLEFRHQVGGGDIY